MRLTFHLDCEELIFDRISWNTYPNRMGLISLWSRSENISYELKFIMNSSSFFWILVAFSSSVNGFEVVQPIFTKFDSSSNYEWHWDGISSSWLTHMNTQSFRKISQLVIFKLSSCDLSPPLEPITGGSSKVHRKIYTHPNSIPLGTMGSRRQEEETRKDPFWYFWADRLWPFNFHPDIFKIEYLGFYSSDWKTEDSSGKLEIGRRHGQKPIFIYLFFHLHKSLWLFTSPKVKPWARDLGEIFETWVFIF